MRTITINLRGSDFAVQMGKMRTWLDSHRFEPARFTYKQSREIVAISVDFEKDHDAETFKSCFDGEELAADLTGIRLEAPSRVHQAVGNSETPATMAQACWWRLLGEEIRTEADNFGSATAKETMELAARGWEQLAEELERRLARNGDQQRGFFG